MTSDVHDAYGGVTAPVLDAAAALGVGLSRCRRGHAGPRRRRRGHRPASGSTFPNAAQSRRPFTAGIPFSSGQNINVVVPANAAFADAAEQQHMASTSSSARPPTVSCPPDRRPVTATPFSNGILPNPDGSFSLTDYTVYALPDSVSLGEGSSGPPLRTDGRHRVHPLHRQQPERLHPAAPVVPPFFINARLR